MTREEAATLTVEDVQKATTALKRNKAAESQGALTCGICGKRIFGLWMILYVPSHGNIIIHADYHTHPCLVKAVEIIKESKLPEVEE